MQRSSSMTDLSLSLWLLLSAFVVRHASAGDPDGCLHHQAAQLATSKPPAAARHNAS